MGTQARIVILTIAVLWFIFLTAVSFIYEDYNVSVALSVAATIIYGLRAILIELKK